MVGTRLSGAFAAQPPARQSASTDRTSTTSAVSLPLVDIIEALAHHVPMEKRQTVLLLARLAREKPEQEQRVKEQLLIVGGADALRAAVCSLLGAQDKGGSSSSSSSINSSVAAPAPAPEVAVRPPSPPLRLAPLHPVPTSDPRMPPANLAAIFGSTQPDDEFRASLVHAFHCCTPSCPVAGCESLTSKLGRLQLHVSSCTESYCLLCRIWTYLKCYPCAAPHDISKSHSFCRPVDAPSASGPLHSGSLAPAPLLPRWHPDGRISWVSPQEALTHLQALTSGTFDGARDGAGSEAASKRHAGPGAVRHGAFDFATAHSDYLASLQGVVPGARAHHATAVELPRPTATAPTSRVVPGVEPLESFNFDHLVGDAPRTRVVPGVGPHGGTPPLNSLHHFGGQCSSAVSSAKQGVGGASSAVSSATAAVPGTSALPAAPPLFKGRHKRTLTSEPTRTSSTFARSASGLHVPLLNPLPPGLPSQAGLAPGMAPWMAPEHTQFGNGAHSGLGGSGLHAGGALVGSQGGGNQRGGTQGGCDQFPPELKFEVMQGFAMHGSRSLNLSGNLADLLRSSSNLDLSLLGMSSSDLGSLGFRNDAKAPSSANDHFCASPALTGLNGLTDTPKLGGLPFARGQSFGLTDTPKLSGVPFARGQSFGLPLARGRSGLDKCASEFSLSGFLNEEAMGGGGYQSSGSSGTSPPVDDGLNDIMNDFSGGSGPQHPGQRLVSA